jgi:hypothetical protein
MTKSFEQRTAFYLAFELAFHLDNARYYYQSTFDNSIRKNQWKQHMSKAEAIKELAITLFETVGMTPDSDIESILTELSTIASGVPQNRWLSPEADKMFAEFV